MFPFAINGDIEEGETREAAEGGLWRVEGWEENFGRESR